MWCFYFFLQIFIFLLHNGSCFYNLCTDHDNILNEKECSDLYFDFKEKYTNLAMPNLKFSNNALNISLTEAMWETVLFRLSHKNTTQKVCGKFTDIDDSLNWYYDCLTFDSASNERDFLFELKTRNNLKTVSRKILLSLPAASNDLPIFSYIDFTHTSRLILKVQKLPESYNVSYYKVEVFKERDNTTLLQDIRLFPNDKDVMCEHFTYNDVGYYYFVISIINENCPEDYCPKVVTPKIYIERKGMHLIIGIVGASFILPFVLFIFHIITKKYHNVQEEPLQSEEKIVMLYKSSFKKHNEVVAILAKLVQRLSKIQVLLDATDEVKTKKCPEKFCNDSIIEATHIIYIAPPINESEIFHFNFPKSEIEGKEICSVIFNYCTEHLPPIFQNHKIFHLLNDFDSFIRNFATIENRHQENDALYKDLERNIAEIQNDNQEDLPTIVVTEVEPHEQDTLISKVI